MNQQQLQIERAARWRQNGDPLLTLDSAAAWLDETGLCLFLPRHAQLPAPAPSLIEACAGKAAAVHSPAAIASAMELVTRLVEAKSGVALNLMGNYTEQPDFLSSPEALRWIAAVRGDRNWKSAPGGHTAPIVLHIWEALDAQPAQTAAELGERLGRSLTEGAVLRALIELWTTLRAFPVYALGQPTRWSLGKQLYPKELAAGANMAQSTALSGLISLYLRAAVAATEEEVEIFLSPLTARSRVREVLHGMLAARQFATTAVDFQTLLFLEGSLPEFAPEPEAPAEAAPGARSARPFRSPRPEQPGRPERRERPESDRGKKPPFHRGPRRDFQKPWQKRGEFRPQEAGDRTPRRHSPRPAAPGAPRRPDRERPAGRPWQPGETRAERPARFGKRSSSFEKNPREGRPQRFEKRQPGRPPGGPPREGQRPWQKKPFAARPGEPRREGAGEFRKEGSGEPSAENRSFRPGRDSRGGKPSFGGKPAFGAKKFGPRKPGFGGKKFDGKPGAGRKPDFGSKPAFGAKKFGGKPGFAGKKFTGKPGFVGKKPAARPPRVEGEPSGEKRPFRAASARPSRPASNRPRSSRPSGPASARPFRPGAAGTSRPGQAPRGPRPPQGGRAPGRFSKPAKKGFRKPSPPGKNRKREDEA